MASKEIQKTNQNLVEKVDFRILTLNDLSNPVQIQRLFEEVKRINPFKKRIGLPEINILLEKRLRRSEVAEKMSQAILSADNKIAKFIWNISTPKFKYEMILPGAGEVNLDLINKLDLRGKMVCKAFLSHKNLPVPRQTAYATIFGEYSYDDAAELALILEELWNSGVYGKVLVQEFFEFIDIRVLFLIGISEMGSFVSDSSDDGREMYIALKTDDQLPIDLNFLCWMQLRIPEKYSKLREELLNPKYPEDRNLFWETFRKQNKPHLRENNFFPEKQERFNESVVEKNLDASMKIIENGSGE
ncbi:MAG: hypothetical protein NTW62_00975 [Candidatus Nomurabacteria bacterium]|nr:hypothetical protein [Candidatus Nomurabacteria bacterium]